MKRIFLFAVVMLLAYAVNAQPTGGNMFIGGSFDFDHELSKYKYSGGSSEETDNYTTFSLWPTAGYFLNDKMAVGASLGFNLDVHKNPATDIDKTISTEIGVGPFFRYYLISGTGGLFAEASIYAGIGSIKYDYTDASSVTNNLYSFSMGITPGAYYYITPKIALVGEIGWLGFATDITKYEDDDKWIDNEFGFRVHPSYVSLGLNITL